MEIDFLNGFFSTGSPQFFSISTNINKIDNGNYSLGISGNINAYEISNSNSFMGLLPQSYFTIDAELDSKITNFTADAKINLNGLDETDLYGSARIEFGVSQSKDMLCNLVECEVSDFELAYTIFLGDEWIKGGADCLKFSCRLDALHFFVQTSNTIEIFTILNQVGILTSLSSFICIVQ